MKKFFDFSQKVNYKNEILAGLTVSLVLVPEAVAFAMIAGLSPITGLYAGFIMGLVTSILGGRPGMISGATGAVAIVLVVLAKSHGIEYILATVILAGILQAGAGLMKLGKFIRLVPQPVVFGFVNGLAIVIFMAQMGSFKQNVLDDYGNNAIETVNVGEAFHVDNNAEVRSTETNTLVYNLLDSNKLYNNETNELAYEIIGENVYNVSDSTIAFNYVDNIIYNIEKKGDLLTWLDNKELLLMIGLVLLTILIIWGLPKITKAVPAALVAILVVFGVVTLFPGLETKTIGDVASIAGKFPEFSIPSVPFTLETLKLIFPYAAIMAGVGLIESLLTLNIIDELTETRGNSNRETIAQGAGNILAGLFGGMGGCVTIGQSLVNISSGARARLSGIFASLMLLVFIMYGSSIIEQIPMAALTGVMIMIAATTFEWASLKTLTKMPKSDVIIMVIVTLVTAIAHNIALAVGIGVISAALVFAWDNAKRIRARKNINDQGVKTYDMYGPLFFGSINAFTEKFDVINDPKHVIINFKDSRVVDMSAIEALNKLTERYAKLDKKVQLKHLSPDCIVLLQNADKLIDVDVIDDPTYKVIVDDL